jgi:hypothetical protein
MTQTTIYDFIKSKHDTKRKATVKSKNQSQMEWVKENLLSRGFITRNECLREYITRLADIIYKLKQDGIKIDGEDLNSDYGTDYIYFLD